MTTLITISSLIIGAILGAWWQNHRDIKEHRILANRNIDLTDSIIGLNWENESLRFQIQQHNIGRDEIKFTQQG